jgi:hypothetical protein
MGSLIGRDALEDMVPGERAKRTESAGALLQSVAVETQDKYL